MLREPALNALLELLGDVYAFEDLDTFRPGVMEAVGRAVPADYVSYNEVGERPEEIIAFSEPELPAEYHETWSRVAPQHPVLRHNRRTLDGRPTRISDLTTREEFHALELYRDFYRLIGVESQVAFTLPASPPLVIAIALSRGPADFSDEECELLARARPHLIQAYRAAQASERRERVLDALGRGIEGGGGPVVVADRQGTVHFAGPDAGPLLARSGGVLDPRVREWVARSRGGASEPLLLGEGDDAPCARLLPGRRPGDLDVLLLDATRSQLTVEALSGLGLTQREAEALRWVALGRSAPEAARLMGVAPRTVAKHLQHVYAKLGVRSRSQAAATAWASVSGGEDLLAIPEAVAA